MWPEWTWRGNFFLKINKHACTPEYMVKFITIHDWWLFVTKNQKHIYNLIYIHITIFINVLKSIIPKGTLIFVHEIFSQHFTILAVVSFLILWKKLVITLWMKLDKNQILYFKLDSIPVVKLARYLFIMYGAQKSSFTLKHGLQTPGEEIAFTARPKNKS